MVAEKYGTYRESPRDGTGSSEPMLPAPGRQDASVCRVAQPSWWLPVLGAVGHWGLVLGPSKETQEDNTCGRAKADPGAAGGKKKVVCGGPWPSKPGKTSLKFQH